MLIDPFVLPSLIQSNQDTRLTLFYSYLNQCIRSDCNATIILFLCPTWPTIVPIIKPINSFSSKIKLITNATNEMPHLVFVLI